MTIVTPEFTVPAQEINVFAVVNDDGQQTLPYILDGQENGGSFPINDIEECDYTNNLDQANFFVGRNSSPITRRSDL